MKNLELFVFTCLSSFASIVLFSAHVFAQSQSVIIDQTTPTIVKPFTALSCKVRCEITGGAIRGRNLFHSFKEFNIGIGEKVLFLDPGVKNIFSRVTGSNSSNILGVLGVQGGDANLFFMNPNGILFGSNASLDLNGSFIASTANAIQFGRQGYFKSSTSAIPDVTVDPSALFFQGPNGKILNLATNDLNSGPVPGGGLSVLEGRSLHLVGGDVIVDSGEINAMGGRIELGGLKESGTVGIIPESNGFFLHFPENVLRADVSLLGASIGVTGSKEGDIVLSADKILIRESRIRAGLQSNNSSSQTRAGDINLNALKSVSISDSSVVNQILPGALGIGGNVNITSKELFLMDSSRVSSNTFGQGNAGNINVDSGNISLYKGSELSSNTIGEGNAGDVNLNSTNVSLFDGSRLASDTFQNGNAGNVKLIISEEFLLDSSQVSSSVANGADGNAAQIYVEADAIVLDNDSTISSSTFSMGNAGDITLKANSINLKLFSGIITSVTEGAKGNSGDIRIYVSDISLTGGSQITSSILNAENGLPGGIGIGGNIFINSTNSVTISGFSQSAGEPSGIYAVTEEGASGSAGNITVNARKFRITNGALVTAQTFNSSNGGRISINTSIFEAINGGQVITSTFSDGNAGNINLNATEKILITGKDQSFEQRLAILEDFLLRDDVDPVVVKEQIQALKDLGPNSGLYANTSSNSSGNAGNIFVDPPEVLIRDGARIAVNSQGSGVGGNIQVIARNLTLDRGFITAATASNKGGDISLQLEDFLFLRNNSAISASAGSPDQVLLGQEVSGGNITIAADNIVAEPNSNSDIFATSLGGKGGVINITARRNLFGFKETDDSTPRDNTTNDVTAVSSVSPDLNGQVNITTGEVDPSDNLSEQPEVVEPPKDIAKGCRPGQSLGGSTFTNVGRGGLPLSPQQTQTPTNVWQDLRSHNLQPTTISSADPSPTSLIPTPPPSITEAKGWTKDTQGRIYLTANVPQPTQTPQPIATC